MNELEEIWRAVEKRIGLIGSALLATAAIATIYAVIA